MLYEQMYKFAVDSSDVFLDEEDLIASTSNDGIKTIYDDESYAYGLLGHVYPQLYQLKSREIFAQAYNNPIRRDFVNRMRTRILMILALTGKEFKKQIETNFIEEIVDQARTNTPRALRKELRKFFDDYPSIWFCILVSSQYVNKLIAHSAEKNGKMQMLRIAGEASQHRSS